MDKSVSDHYTFSNAIDTVITVMLSGLKALSELSGRASAPQEFATTLVTAISALSAALASQATPASEHIGLNIAYGIANGLSAGTPAIQNAIYAAINAALAAARAALGIASPSKVFDELAQFAGAGMAQGFEVSEPMVAAAAGSMAAATISPVESAAITPIGARPGGGGGSTSSTVLNIERGAISIVQQPGENADVLAQKVMKLIEQKYRGRL
jgi:hypothetical protein